MPASRTSRLPRPGSDARTTGLERRRAPPPASHRAGLGCSRRRTCWGSSLPELARSRQERTVLHRHSMGRRTRSIRIQRQRWAPRRESGRRGRRERRRPPGEDRDGRTSNHASPWFAESIARSDPKPERYLLIQCMSSASPCCGSCGRARRPRGSLGRRGIGPE